MSSNATASCPAPFLLETNFPDTGGFVDGRFCSTLLGPSCCLSCPQTEWLYPSNFDTITKSASWVNVAGLACCVFLLVSYAVLPIAKTHRHYLSVCLCIAIAFMQMAFIIPLGANPNQCFNDITPNDMKSSPTCAVSGAFIIFGGWSAVMWISLRSFALHLQICWQIVLGKTFMWGAIATGWGIPLIGLTLALVFSGVSFRFGDTCHINHQNSLADFWIPLLVFAALTLIIQFATFGYCIKVYLASLSDGSTTTGSSGLPSYAASGRATVTPRQAYRRVRRVLELQWRGIAIVLLIVGDVIFFSVVFVFLDDIETNLLKDPAKAATWLACLIENVGDKDQCLSLAAPLVVNEATVMAVLILLSVNGIWLILLLGRTSFFTAWAELLKNNVKPSNEFVSADASRFKDPGSYEMLGKTADVAPEPTFSPVTPLSPAVQLQPQKKDGRETPDYFGREARYKSPARSFSSPKRPQTFSAQGGLSPAAVQWDSRKSHAPPRDHTGMDPLNMNKI